MRNNEFIIESWPIRKDGLLILETLVNAIDKLKQSKPTAEDSADLQQAIQKQCSLFLKSKVAFEKKHRVYGSLDVSNELYGFKRDSIVLIQNFCDLLNPSAFFSVNNYAELLFEFKHGIAFRVLAEELCGGSPDLHNSLMETLRCVLGLDKPYPSQLVLCIYDEIDRREALLMNPIAELSIGMLELVICLLSVVSLPNLAAQLPSDSALDCFSAAAGFVLYIVTILATEFGSLLRLKRRQVWRHFGVAGLVSAVYAFFFSVSFYLPHKYRWLIIFPCVMLVPALYAAAK